MTRKLKTITPKRSSKPIGVLLLGLGAVALAIGKGASSENPPPIQLPAPPPPIPLPPPPTPTPTPPPIDISRSRFKPGQDVKSTNWPGWNWHITAVIAKDNTFYYSGVTTSNTGYQSAFIMVPESSWDSAFYV